MSDEKNRRAEKLPVGMQGEFKNKAGIVRVRCGIFGVGMTAVFLSAAVSPRGFRDGMLVGDVPIIIDPTVGQWENLVRSLRGAE